MRAELAALNLLALRHSPALDILVIESHAGISQECLYEHLRRLAGRVTFRHLPDPRLWGWVEDLGKVLVSHRSLQAIVTWLAKGVV